jgi:hypothetical protein
MTYRRNGEGAIRSSGWYTDLSRCGPMETCRVYPEGIVGLSPGFQPQEQPPPRTRPEWAEENRLSMIRQINVHS